MTADFVSGFLLHRREYRETSFLLDLFTLEFGKVSAVVKGARTSKSHKKSVLQAFQPMQLILSGRQALRNLNQLEACESAIPLVGKAMFCGMYLNELLNRTLATELPMPDLFSHYQHTLSGMAECSESQLEPWLRRFEFTLLAELGYAIDWSSDWQSGEAIQPHQVYAYVNQQGFQALAQPMKNCLSGEAIIKVQQQLWDKQSLGCAKLVSRLAMSELLGNKPLKSRELFASQLIHPEK